MSSFKEFLKNLQDDTEKSVWQRRNRFTKKELDAYLEGKKIHHQKFMIVLGEWAWSQFQKLNSRTDTFEYNQKIAVSNHGIAWCVYWRMAIACLGEKEVRKRLEELK